MLQGWKTLIFSVLVSLLGVAQSADWTNLLGSHTGGLVVTGIGLAGIALRFFTTTPVGQKA